MQVEPKSIQVAKLALEDGTVYQGLAFGARGTTSGEVVFNTSMTGYQEIITDPSYCGQIITMTYPEIGNYGFNEEDLERDCPALAGFVVRNASPVASNYRSIGLLEEFLQRHGIIGISDIDTRALVRKIRTLGALRGVISTELLDDADLVQRARTSPSLVGRDLVREVIPSERSDWNGRLHDLWDYSGERQGVEFSGADKIEAPHIVALDFGMKWNIARHLASQGFRVTILPGTSSADDVLALNPDGVFLSNGPGDPEPLTYAIATIRQ
ncbi:MAG: carbamoyl phosphate synthase small subunit, partial [Planctomycetota bacterium]